MAYFYSREQCKSASIFSSYCKVINNNEVRNLIYDQDNETPLCYNRGTAPCSKYWLAEGNYPVPIYGSDGNVKPRTGTYMVKSHVDRLNTSYNDLISGRGRSEIVYYKTMNVGGEYWMSFSTFIPESHIFNKNIWEIIAQWHDTPDKNIGEIYRNPIMGLSIGNGNYTLDGKWDTQKLTPCICNYYDATGTRCMNFKCTYSGSWKYNIAPIVKDKWVDWVFHVKWNYTNDGFVEAWKDGIKVVDYHGPNAFNDDRGPYFKMGIYNSWDYGWNANMGNHTESTIYHAGFKLGNETSSYDDVSIRS